MSFNVRDFADADKKLLRKLEKEKAFDGTFESEVDIGRVNVEVMTKWVSERLTEVLGFEDEVVIGLVTNLLTQRTDALSGHLQKLDPKVLQVQLTGFLAKQAGPFVTELWGLLLDAQDAPHGIPKVFLERKKAQLRALQTRNRAAPRGAVTSDTLAENQRQTVVAFGGTRNNNRRQASDESSSEDERRRRRRRSRSPSSDGRRRRPQRRSRSRDRPSSRDRRQDDDRRPQQRRSRSRSRDRPRDLRQERRRPSRSSNWDTPSSSSKPRDHDAKSSSKPDRDAKIVVRHLLLKHAACRRPSSWRQEKIVVTKDAVRRELEELRRRIQTAVDTSAELGAIAEKRSDCVSASKGGLLKPFKVGDLDRTFEEAAFALKPQTLSDIIETPSGLHVIYRES